MRAQRPCFYQFGGDNLNKQLDIEESNQGSFDRKVQWAGRKIIFTHNTTKYLLMHYRALLESFVSNGAEAVVLAPFDDTVHELEKSGIRCIDITLSRQGLNPLKEVSTLGKTYRFLSKEQPYCVFNYSIKPVIYGSIAARLAGVENIFSMVTGLGHLFTDQSLKYKSIRTVILPLYRIAIRWNSGVFFQNPDDKKLFVYYGLVREPRGHFVNGTGLNLK